MLFQFNNINKFDIAQMHNRIHSSDTDIEVRITEYILLF
jgi:hypothetical protein